MNNTTQREEQIRLRAYCIFLRRGSQHGHDVDDWLQAERELASRAHTHTTASEGNRLRGIAVIFDTNAYRDMCDADQVSDPMNECERYLAAMRQHDIIAFANPFVIMELASHLADITDPNYQECRLALRAQHRLCSIDDHRTIRILSDSEALMVRALYGVEPSDETTQRLCTLSCHVFENTPGTLATQACAAFWELQEVVAAAEQRFVSDMWEYVVKELNPSSIGWAPLENDDVRRTAVLALLRTETILQTIAQGFALKAMIQSGRADSPEEISKKSKFVLNHFAASIHLYHEILTRIVETGCNLNKKKRANWIWDIQIAMGLGRGIETVNKTLHLVTTDDDIVQASESAGCRECVHRLSEFRTAVGM